MSFIADAGIPMLFWQWPLAIAVLVPVIAVETVIAWAVLRQPLVAVARRVGIANAASTMIGIPLAWLFMVIVELLSGGGSFSGFATPWAAFQSIVLSAPWLPPHEAPILRWLIPAATIVLLVPYFLVSLAIEKRMMLRRWPSLPPSRVVAAAWLGNLATYAALAAWAFVKFHQGLHPAGYHPQS